MPESDASFTPRHWVAVTALIGALVALYLHLWKLGLMGTLTCNAQHSCEFVMTSEWSRFLGIDVALIGTVGYTLILIVALAGTAPERAKDRGITMVLGALIVFGFLFTVRLKYYEYVVMRAFCRWCFVSTVIITTQLVAVWLDQRRLVRRSMAPPA